MLGCIDLSNFPKPLHKSIKWLLILTYLLCSNEKQEKLQSEGAQQPSERFNSPPTLKFPIS